MNILWYLLAIVAAPIIMVLGAIFLPGVLGAFWPVTPLQVKVLSYLTSFIPVMVINGPLGEELGWDGFALPKLQKAYGSFNASLILGTLWGFWHLSLLIVLGFKGSSTD